MSSKAARLLSVRRWDFVGDPKLQSILTRDYKELRQIIKVGARKSAIVMCGSILEAILVAKLSTPDAQTKYLEKYSRPLDGVQNLTLEKLIDTCTDIGYLDANSKIQANMVRNYRNLIHPSREKREETELTVNLFVAVVALFNHVITLITPTPSSLSLTPKEKFIKRLARKCNAEELEVAKQIITWAERNDLQHRWSSQLTYVPRLIHDGHIYTPIAIRTNGKFVILFGQLMKKPSVFRHEKHREALRKRLNEEALGQRIPASRIDRNPSFPLRLLSEEMTQDQFINILDWVVTSIRQ